jgi:twitching motility protein PilT
MKLDDFLRMALEKGASDVHLKAGLTPVIRKDGSLRPLSSKIPPLSKEEMEELCFSMMDPQQKQHFKEFKEVDMGYGVSGLGRFRVSVFVQRGSLRMVLRAIPHIVPTIQSLNLPESIAKLSTYQRGLILVTGITGSGKSSTLAAIIDDINQKAHKHILTLEDPIEYLIRDRKSLITQREIGTDTTSFSRALRAGLRQDPDVIFIGEMRDQETVEISLMAAETGHLVLSTLHTLDATETVNRIISYFEGVEQRQVRAQLASVLRAVVSQRLCQKADGKGMVPAVELLINNPRVKGMIENPEETKDLVIAIEEGHTAWGMQSFDQSLMGLLDGGLITVDEALRHATRPEDFRVKMEGIAAMDGRKWSNQNINAKNKDEWSGIDDVELDVVEATKTNITEPRIEIKKKTKN